LIPLQRQFIKELINLNRTVFESEFLKEKYRRKALNGSFNLNLIYSQKNQPIGRNEKYKECNK